MRDDDLLGDLVGQRVVIERFRFGHDDFRRRNFDLFGDLVGHGVEVDGCRHALRDRTGTLFVDDDVVCRRFGLRDDDLLGHHLGEQVVVDLFRLGHFDVGNDHLFGDLFGKTFVIDAFRDPVGNAFVVDIFGDFAGDFFVVDAVGDAAGDLLRALFVHHDVVIEFVGHAVFDDFRNAVVIDGIGHDRRGLCSLVHTVVIDRFGLRQLFGYGSRHRVDIERKFVRHRLRDDRIVDLFGNGRLFRHRFGNPVVVDGIGHPGNDRVRKPVVIDGIGKFRDDRFGERIVVDGLGIGGHGHLGDDHVREFLVIDLLRRRFGQGHLFGDRLRQRVGIHLGNRLDDCRGNIRRKHLFVGHGGLDALRRLHEVFVDAAIVHLIGIRKGFHHLFRRAVNDAVVIDGGGSLRRNRSFAEHFRDLFPHFFGDPGIIDIFRYGDSGDGIENFLVMGGDARFRFFADGFADLFVIDFFLRGQHFRDLFGDRSIVRLGAGSEFVEFLFDLGERLVDLFQNLHLSLYGLELGEHVVRENAGQRLVDHLVLLVPVLELTHHGLRGLRVGLRSGTGLLLNGLIQRTRLQRVVLQLVHQFFFHLLQIVRKSVVESLDHEGSLISPRRYVCISLKRGLLLVVVSVIRHITPQFVLLLAKKSDKP